MASIFSNPIVAMLIMLGGLVLFHEAGHFLVGRLCGVAVETFSIGFGGTILSKRRGHTTYQISWLPLGGYVKFYGATRNEDVPAGLEGRLYTDAAVWKRALIVLAGPAANFLLAFLIFWVMVMAGIERPPATVGDVIEGGRAQVAGIMPGDEFVQIDGEPVKVWTDIERIISRNPERPLPVVVERLGKRIEMTLTPEAVPGLSLFGSRTKIGRAGVALGYPSAVVAVVDPASMIAKAGLKTGDRVESYTINGVTSKVLGFHHLLKLVKRWKHDEVGPVQLHVIQVQVVEDGGKVSEKTVGDSRPLTVRPAEWPASENMTDRAYGKQLGILDSHLTLAVVHGDAVGTLIPGDQIVSWNGAEVRTIYHLQEMMGENLIPTANIGVIRDGKSLDLTVKLKPYETQKPEGAITVYILDVTMLGMSNMPDPVIEQHSNPVTAASVAVGEAYRQTSMMVVSLWSIVTGQTSLKALGGPIMIAKVAGDSAKAGLMTFVAMMAVISINLGLVNLFPIPVLDGGQLVMLGAELLKGRPLTERTLENFQKLGFVLVLCLIVLAMYNDLSRFWKSMISSIMG